MHPESPTSLPLRLLLAFSAPATERRFLQHYAQFYRRYAQASLLLGMLLVVGDWLVDYLAYAQVTANTFRLSLSLPLLLVGLLASGTRYGKAHWQSLMVGVIVSVGFALYWTLMQMDLQGGNGLASWVGILNFTFFQLYCFVILGIGFRYALMAGFVLFLGFEVFVYLHLASGRLTFAYLTYHTFTVFLLSASIGWWREYLLRQAFEASNALEEATRIARSQADFLQRHDAVTGLLNLAGFAPVWVSAVARAEKQSTVLPLLLIDMERLRRAGNALDQKAADALLLSLVERLRSVAAQMQPAPVLARASSFEFAVLMCHVTDTGAIIDASEQFLDALTAPMDTAGQAFHVQPVGGLALYPQDGDSLGAALKAARVALTLDGREERNLHFYDPQRNQALSQRLKLEDDLRQALGKGELSLVYQPLMRITDQQAIGVETLLRWTHPEHGSVSPVQFVPILEELGLIHEVGDWVLTRACQQAARWLATGCALQEISVNVSGVQLAAPDFVPRVARALRDSALSPQCLVLELTESVLVHDSDHAIAQLHALKQLGLRLALDDFGTGFSALASIARLPLDIIKLDRSFVLAAPTQPTAAAILEGIIALSARLQLTTVAEGIEDAEQLALLAGMGCQLAQGFLFARPCSAEQALGYLQQRL